MNDEFYYLQLACCIPKDLLWQVYYKIVFNMKKLFFSNPGMVVCGTVCSVF